ncbi:phage holin family protein [Sanguibacter suarezii]|uniref:phage holin family protein n=1 Tax=Sanguibacter suarezii TaxID=60921 RepID=UPI00082B145C|nr:phage holin family protein [Sanguibacter suarezii]
MTAPPPGAPRPSRDPAEASVGELFGELTRDFSVLVRQEIALAKAEAQDSAKKAGKGAGMLGGAGWASHFVLLFLSVALWWGLGTWIGDGDGDPALGWSALIVALLWAIIAAILAVQGKAELKKTRGMPQTADTLKKIPDALKGEERS